MKSNLQFDFVVNKETKTVTVKREFAADLNLTWDAWTKPEILDQWWAPKPWTSKTKSMEFKEGGHRLYAMVSPDGDEHWSLMSYTSISPKTNFQYKDAFCDSDKNISQEMPQSAWNLDFVSKGENTLVDITIEHKQLEDLEKIIEMGFEGGFTMTLNSLDELLNSLKKTK